MKRLLRGVAGLVLVAGTVGAQVASINPVGGARPKMDLTGVGDTSIFAPLVIGTSPSAVRTGSGAPGARYWQNRADYDLKATLDTAQVLERVREIRSKTGLPVGVGFGIRDGATARAICEVADAAIIGSRIIQEQLAQELGVSRQPIQQALTLLRQQGVLQDAPGRGLQVAPLDLEHVRHMYDVRAVIEGLAFRKAAELNAQRAAAQGPALIARGRKAVSHHGERAFCLCWPTHPIINGNIYIKERCGADHLQLVS